MICKNCKNTLRTDYSYCPDCGAKVIRNRITIKNLWFDFTERFFNLDNTFLKTFIDLFKKPDIVINGYINGVRKKYLNPVSYFTIALTLGGLLLLLARKNLMSLSKNGFASSVSNKSNAVLQYFEDYINIVYDYQNIMYLFSIPFLVLISKTVFWNKKQFNWSEHFVINLYAFSHISICINFLYLLTYWNTTILTIVSSLSIVFYMVYYFSMFKKLFQLNWESIILKTVLFLVIMGAIYVFLIIVIGIYMFTHPELMQQLKTGVE